MSITRINSLILLLLVDLILCTALQSMSKFFTHFFFKTMDEEKLVLLLVFLQLMFKKLRYSIVKRYIMLTPLDE